MNKSDGMIDVSNKDITIRTAKAIGTICIGSEAYEIVRSGHSIKGDVLATAKIAGVQAVKSTSSLIPLCHSLLIEAVGVDFVLKEQDKSVSVTVTVKSTGKTGVEMEALTGVSAACLTIYDMLKYTGKAMTITEMRLLEKTGGKSGDYKRQN
ncbi:MAG: cyclic pyranopterin monophosphate synthase MoaC [Planctomycetota bacterium]|jgi:cyclic pyranopterin phosphate synthase